MVDMVETFTSVLIGVALISPLAAFVATANVTGTEAALIALVPTLFVVLIIMAVAKRLRK